MKNQQNKNQELLLKILIEIKLTQKEINIYSLSFIIYIIFSYPYSIEDAFSSLTPFHYYLLLKMTQNPKHPLAHLTTK
jgi:hypothetical protein